MYNNLNHVALILDGNKRWAKKNKFSNIYGYTKGFDNIKALVKYSLSIKLPILTIFALSSENFNRSSIGTIYKIIYDNFSNMFDERDISDLIFGSDESDDESESISIL